MKLLDERRVAGESTGIQPLHFLDERLDFLGGLGIFAHGLAQLIQIAQRVIIGALRGNRRIVGLNGRSSARRIIPRVKVAVHAAIGPAAKISAAIAIAICAATDSRARSAAGAAAKLARLLTALAALSLPLALCLSLSAALLLPLSLLASLAVAR